MQNCLISLTTWAPGINVSQRTGWTAIQLYSVYCPFMRDNIFGKSDGSLLSPMEVLVAEISN